MKSPRVAVIDYGVGNIRSVKNATNFFGADALLTSDPMEIKNSDGIILPGVGAFHFGMQALEKSSLLAPILSAVANRKPIFGICLGMQLLFERSYEFGQHDGMGLLEGEVISLKEMRSDADEIILPNVNWLTVKSATQKDRPTGVAKLLSSSLSNKEPYYFVHSFGVKASNKATLALANYNGVEFGAVVGNDNVFGTQFHPEKSSGQGLKIIHKFLQSL